MPDCRKFKKRMSLYIDAALPQKDEKSFLKHIKECEKCSKELDSLQTLVQELKILPKLELDNEFHSEVMELIKSVDKKATKFSEKIFFKYFSKYSPARFSWALSSFVAVFLVFTLLIAGAGNLIKTNVNYPGDGGTSMNFETFSTRQEISRTMVTEKQDDYNSSDMVTGAAQISTFSAARGHYAELPASYALGENVYANNALIDIEVENFDLLMSTLNSSELNILDSNVNVYSGGVYASVKLATPAYAYTQTINSITGMGVVKNIYEYSYLCGDEIFETYTTLEVKKAQYDRLFLLFTKADTIENMILIENNLTNLIHEIDYFELCLNSLYNQVENPVITLTVNEYYLPKAASYSLGEKVTDSFENSLAVTVNAAENVLVAASGLFVPVILIMLAAFSLKYLITKIYNHHKKGGK